ASITPIMKEEEHSAGGSIFHKGDLGTGMYVIYTGEVAILDGDTELARFGRGDFFGELALLDTESRSATAEAITDVRLLRIDQDDFYDLMEERSEVLRSIVRSLSGRIRRQNELLANRPVLPQE
ncbi:MAG: cyclic nucleotide-binding domain-containing protein, partial [Cytophagaceae bacterium]